MKGENSVIKVGISVPSSGIVELKRCAEAAADYNFDSISVYGDHGSIPPYVALHCAAEELKGSGVPNIGPMGVSVGLHHPELIVNHADFLDAQMPRRTMIGLVRGAYPMPSGLRQASLDDLEQAVGYIRQRTANYHRKPIPIYIGGFGPKMFQLAGKLSVDALKIGGSANPEVASIARQYVDNYEVKIILGSVSVIDNDRKAARSFARRCVANHLAIIGYNDPTLDPYQKLSLDMFNKMRQEGNAMAPFFICDDLLDKFALAGTPDDALHALENMGQKGVQRFEFKSPLGLTDCPTAIKMIGESIVKELGD